MCVFCAAIPVAAAVGAKARADQLHEARLAESDPGKHKKPAFPAGKATAVVITGLVIGSITVHTHLLGI
ncbi:MAG TPA: hypothetical protein VMT46_04945 [Anaerolineaceae bacterium]|nr:hypothetical protein [Anaerolineaceae bacterium]